MDHYNILNIELRKAGVPKRTFMGEAMEPIDVLVNSEVSSQPYKGILIQYLDELSGNECEMVVRALTGKNNKSITDSLIKLFDRTDLSEHNLGAVGNAINVIKDKTKIDSYIKICKRSGLGTARTEIIKYLGSIKTKEVFELLTHLLNDKTVQSSVIEALGRSGNSKAIELLNKLDLEETSHAYRTRSIAINKLKKAAGNN